jgi:phenylacetate-CoA ligase
MFPLSVAPILRRRVLEPAWSRYTGAPVLAATRALENSQWYSHDELRDRQLALLRRLLTHVYRTNSFYRDRFERVGFSPSDVSSLDDLRRLPILTKDDVRKFGREMLSGGFQPSALMSAKTGGSTGKPVELFFTEEVSQLRNASGRRNKAWAGWKVGEPIGAVWGNPIFPKTLRERLRSWVLAPSISLDTMAITPEAVRAFEREWRQVRPTLLFGHAHSLFILATMVQELGVQDIRPNAIIASSMMLLPHERAVIERVFGVRVTDIYGCEEVGLIAGECERHEGLHLNVDQLVVEILREDGTPAGPGESGLVVVTDLLNEAMPFIRYRMEDMAEVAVAPCSCGRGLPTISRVVGRTADFLRRRDGSRVAGISLIENTLTKIPGIEQMQIVQEQLLEVQVRVVAGRQFDGARHRELVDYFRATFPGAAIDLQQVAGISQEQNGKYRFSICRVPDEPVHPHAAANMPPSTESANIPRK